MTFCDIDWYFANISINTWLLTLGSLQLEVTTGVAAKLNNSPKHTWVYFGGFVQSAKLYPDTFRLRNHK